MPTTKEILIAARKKIEKEEDWGKGRRIGRPLHTCCAAEAIEEAAEDLIPRVFAFRALRCAVGVPDAPGRLVEWNDAPERTHAEVLAAFDKAIAAS